MDGHPYNSKSIGCAIAGGGRVYTSGYRSTAEAKVLKDFPDATFEDSFFVEDGEVNILKGGVEAYRKWIRDGRPSVEQSGVESLMNWSELPMRQRRAVADWIASRIRDVQPDRESIEEVEGFDLVSAIEALERHIRAV
jgi:hypothetical protein